MLCIGFNLEGLGHDLTNKTVLLQVWKQKENGCNSHDSAHYDWARLTLHLLPSLVEIWGMGESNNTSILKLCIVFPQPAFLESQQQTWKVQTYAAQLTVRMKKIPKIPLKDLLL